MLNMEEKMKTKKILSVVWFIVSILMLAFFVGESITFANAGYIKVINGVEMLVAPFYYWLERCLIFLYTMLNAVIALITLSNKRNKVQ